MEIRSAVFVKSSSKLDECPSTPLPEFAFIGRSNVGKSSLINLLTGVKGLAKTSAQPGKTKLINHFLINQSWYLVDLPGYGFAKVSQADRKQFEQMIQGYLRRRKNLVSLFVLVDSRHEPLANDIAFINKLAEDEVPFSLVFTKTDKLSTSQLRSALARYKTELNKYWAQLPMIYLSSVTAGTGKAELLDYISEMLQLVKSDSTQPTT